MITAKRILALTFYVVFCFSVASTENDEKAPPSIGDLPNDAVGVSCEKEAGREDSSWPSQDSRQFSCNMSDFKNGEKIFTFDHKLKINGKPNKVNFPEDSLLTVWSDVTARLLLGNITAFMHMVCFHLFQNEKVLRIRFELKMADPDVKISPQTLLEYYEQNDSSIKKQIDELLQTPVAVTRNCPEDIVCGNNAQCTTVLNEPKCRCFDNHKGNPQQTCFGFCGAKTVCGFSFPETWSGTIATSDRKCPSDFPEASVLCQPVTTKLGRRTFGFTTFRRITCGTNVASIISAALNSTATARQLEDYASYLQILTLNSSAFSAEDATRVVEFLSEVSNRDSKLTTDTSFRSLVTVATQLVLGYWQANPSQARNLSRLMAQSLPQMTLRTSFSENQTQFRWQSNAFALQTTQLNNATNQSLMYIPTIRATTNGSSSIQPISLQIPASAIERAAEQQSRSDPGRTGLRTAFLYYRNDDLFNSETRVTNVLSVNLGDNLTLNELEEPVKISHLNVNAKYGKTPLEGVQLLVNQTTMQCVFWNFTTDSWSSNGCCLNITSDFPECQCNHLTNFALIVRSEDVPANFELQIVSFIGCILSIIGLSITIAVMAVKKDLRKYWSSKILLHICCNLFIVYITFISGASSAVGNTVGCIVVTALLHYFFLTTWCWMTVYSFEMYTSLVKVFAKHKNGFIIRCYVFSYGVTALVVIVTAAASLGSSANETNNENLCGSVEDVLAEPPYHADNVCWLRGYPLYFGFLLPAGLLLAYNLVTFALVTYKLNQQSSTSDQLKRATIDSLLIATTMTFIIGLAWIFGYILLISVDMTFYTVMSWLFAVFNTLQGFGIFVLTSIRREDMRNVWWGPIKRFFKRKKLQQPSSRSSTHMVSDRKHNTGSHFIMSET